MSLPQEYKLESEEALALCLALGASQVLFLIAGMIGSILMAGFSSSDWAGALAKFTWVRDIGAALTALPAPATLAVAAGAATVMYALALGSERRAMSTEKGRASIRTTRRGVNGELPRLPLAVQVVLMTLTGFAEELAFRFVLLGALLKLLALALPYPAAALSALVISSAAFWLAHGGYRSAATALPALMLGLVLGATFLLTESLAAAALAHALYNLAVLVRARIKMRQDPDYFGGEAPTRVITGEDA